MQQDVQEHQRRAERIESLIQEVANFPDPHAREATEELLQALLDMYGEGLARVLEITEEKGDVGHALIASFASDDLLASLFLLHGLHPIDIETRLTQALDEVRPYLKSHGGNVELLRVEDGVAYLRLQGSCHGCPSSAMTLKLAIEEAIHKAAPDLERLEVEGVTEPKPPAIPVSFVPSRRQKDSIPSTQRDSAWTIVKELGARGGSQNQPIQTLSIQGKSLLFCWIVDTYYAYHNRCTSCHESLSSAKLDKTTLICSSCGRQYDVCRAGRCLDAPNVYLEPVPLLVENGQVKVALSDKTQDDQSQEAMSAPTR
ncbi:MAG: NifU family protein [Chloroflexi bacterium]|nr:NifU family protein [Ktedonobacteraceae bacterium]MBV9706515.1 NifU family protein [Chloroflexota bacterium]